MELSQVLPDAIDNSGDFTSELSEVIARPLNTANHMYSGV